MLLAPMTFPMNGFHIWELAVPSARVLRVCSRPILATGLALKARSFARGIYSFPIGLDNFPLLIHFTNHCSDLRCGKVSSSPPSRRRPSLLRRNGGQQRYGAPRSSVGVRRGENASFASIRYVLESQTLVTTTISGSLCCRRKSAGLILAYQTQHVFLRYQIPFL